MRELDYGHTVYDTLVIGAGGAGLAAAIASAGNGAKTAIISKGPCGRSGATYYNLAELGAYNCPDDSGNVNDSVETFYEDIMSAALGMSSAGLSRIVAEQSSICLDEILHMPGGDRIFQKDSGRYMVFKSCFSSKPRAHIMHDHFRPLLEVLLRQAASLPVDMIENVTVADLIVSDGVCCGAYGYDAEGNEVVVRAKNTILAAGGASKIFAHNMYPDDITGDSYAMAYRAGACLTNLEFIQMGIGVGHPFVNLFENYLWNCYPTLKNAQGKAFLASYLPDGLDTRTVIRDKSAHFPFSTRDYSKYVEIAIKSEIDRGNVNGHGCVYLDVKGKDFDALLREENEFSKMWDTTYNWYRQKGIDILEQPLEVACFAHAINGGVLIDENAMSSVEGLYAAGECAAGPHGADRLGGNMSLASMVFGRIAGMRSAERAAAVTLIPDVDAEIKQLRDFWRGISLNPGITEREVMDKIGKESDRALLVIRSGERLEKYLDALDACRKACIGENTGRQDAVSVLNAIETGKLIARAALERKESRGGHYREDYPKQNDEYDENILISSKGIVFSDI